MSDMVATDYARALVRQRFNRNLLKGVVVPFNERYEELVGTGLVHGFGPRHVFRSEKSVFGDCWMVLYVLSKRELVIIKGIDGADWLEIMSTKGVSKVTREGLMRSFYRARKETAFVAERVVQWDKLKEIGEVWKQCCMRGSYRRFEERALRLMGKGRKIPYSEFARRLQEKTGSVRVIPMKVGGGGG